MGLLGSIFTGLTNMGSQAMANAAQNKAIDKQIAAQKEENAKTRNYNMMLARQQNDWTLEQWQRNNDYNSPSAQMSRLKAAGLNPDLMYGQGTTGNSAAPAPMTSGEPAIPQDMSALGQKRSFAEALSAGVNSFMAAEMQRAQIDAIKANTRKVDKETEGIDIDNYIKNGTKEDVIELSEVTVEGAKVLNSMNEAQRESLLKGIEKTSQEIKESNVRIESIKAAIADMSFKQQQDAKRLILDKLRNDATIRNLDASTRKMLVESKLSEQQYFEAVDTFVLRKLGLEEDNKIKDAQVSKLVKEFDVLDNEYENGRINLRKNQSLNGHYGQYDFGSRFMTSTFGFLEKLSMSINVFK